VYKYYASIDIHYRHTPVASHPRLLGVRDARHSLPGHHTIPQRVPRQGSLQAQLLRVRISATVAQFQEQRHIGCKWVHYWTQPRTGDLVFHLDVAQMAMNCATFWANYGAVL
jgi:hypothetical protein